MTEETTTIIGGRYELLERIAEGGMAVVWRGRVCGAAGFSRFVAIKEIKAEYRAVRKYIQMFVEEARIGTELAHANIVQVLDFVIENETHYLVLEWIEGVDFYAFSRAFSYLQQPVPWSLAVAAIVGALQGLSAAHEHCDAMQQASPVVHRDISPQNILLSDAGIAKLSDFGLARAKDRAHALTTPGMLKGKPRYFSPEITKGAGADVQSDQYAMACVLWEVLSGKRLFVGDTALEVFRAIRENEIPDLAKLRPDVPKAIVQAIHRALQKEPAERFPTARLFSREMSECLRMLDGGILDANQRLAAAVVVTKQTLEHHESSGSMTTSDMNHVTRSFQMQLEVESAEYSPAIQNAATASMDSVSPGKKI